MINCKKSILLGVVFSIFFSCKISGNNEQEPNNTFINANPVTAESEISGFLDSENDIDNYIFNSSQDQIIRLDLSGIKGVNHSINIYRMENGTPQLIKIIDDNRKSSFERFSNLFVTTGQYIFSISHGSRDLKKGNSETPYKFKLSSRSFINEEREPNDTESSATPLLDSTPLTGYFSPGRNSMNTDPENQMIENDWYRFDARISDVNPILLDINLSGVDNVDSAVSLYNSSLEKLITIDSAGTGEGETLSEFGIKVSGTYYLNVYSKNYISNNDIPYEIKISYKQYDSNSELEPNNSFINANTIHNNNIKGKISNGKDTDIYSFSSGTSDEFYGIICSGSDKTDLVLTVFDYENNRLYDFNNAGPGEAEKVPPFLVRKGMFIEVSAPDTSGSDASYNLEIIKFQSDLPVEIEPNNIKAQSNVFHGKVAGFTNSRKDKDYFLIQYDTRRKALIKVKGVKNGKIRVSTTDPLGFIIKSKDINPDEEVSINEIFDKRGFIIVETVEPDFEFPYSISIEER